MARVLVVGAGPAGLVTALELGRRGHAVAVLEAAAALGGRAGTARVDGWVLDAGPHWMRRGRSLERMLRKMMRGRPPHGRLDPAGWRRLEDERRLPMPLSAGLVKEHGGTVDVQRLGLRLGRRLAKAAAEDPQARLDAWTATLPAALAEGVLAGATILTQQHPVDGLPLRTVSDAWSRLPVGQLMLPEGGHGLLIEALALALGSIDVPIHTGRRIERLRWARGGGEVLGVTVEGDRSSAEAVVLAVPRRAARRLLEGAASELQPPKGRHRSVALLDVGLAGDPLQPHELLIDRGRGVMITVPSRAVPDRVPEAGRAAGWTIVQAMAWLENGEEDGIARIEAVLDTQAAGWRNLVKVRRDSARVRLPGGPVSGDAAVHAALARRRVWLAGADWTDTGWHTDDAVDHALNVAEQVHTAVGLE